MTAATLVTLALSLSLGQAHGEPAPAQEAEVRAPAAGVAEAAPAHEGQAEGHAAGGHAEGGLSEVMMGHVTDGYMLEYPGRCHGEWAWNCEVDLKEVFGERFVFEVGGTRIDMTPTKHLLMMWAASLILLVSVLWSVRRRSLVPRGFYNFVETMVQFVRVEIAGKNIGEKDGDRFVPYLVTAFFFILFVNLFGMIPFTATATGNLAVTVALALFTFVITQYAAIKAMGFGAWLKHLTGGVAMPLWPIMIVVEVLGLFTKPFALTVRLFANMVAGHIVILSLLGLIYALNSQWVAVGSVPMALGIFLLELFVAFVQAYIFTMLSAVFIGQGLAHHGDEEHAHAEAGHGPADHGSHVAGASPGHG